MNRQLGKTMWWDVSKPLPEGWEYGQYLNKDQIEKKSKEAGNRIWVCKDGHSDKMIPSQKLDDYLKNGWSRGRNHMPSWFGRKMSMVWRQKYKDGK